MVQGCWIIWIFLDEIAPTKKDTMLKPTRKISSTGLGQEGWIYIPNNCMNKNTKKCKLHVNFHGTIILNQDTEPEWAINPSVIGDNYFKRAGWLEYAASNDLIMLFP